MGFFLFVAETHALRKQPAHSLSTFLSLFRYFGEELCAYFEDEQLSPAAWALPWLTHLLASALPLPSVLRLWDTYLSTAEGFDLHPYVCVALLLYHTEELLELEYSQLLAFLQHLPVSPEALDPILVHAANLREEVATLKLL
jgi:hypothetical protein